MPAAGARQATPGKMAIGIKVTALDGQRIAAQRAPRRVDEVEEDETKFDVKELLRYGIDNSIEEEFNFPPVVAAPSSRTSQ